jgi:hypothetical protein
MINRKSYTILAGLIFEKLGETKFTENISTILLNVCKFLSPKFVVNYLLAFNKNLKKPLHIKGLNELCTVLEQIL